MYGRFRALVTVLCIVGERDDIPGLQRIIAKLVATVEGAWGREGGIGGTFGRFIVIDSAIGIARIGIAPANRGGKSRAVGFFTRGVKTWIGEDDGNRQALSWSWPDPREWTR
jgi:hypothetical protein